MKGRESDMKKTNKRRNIFVIIIMVIVLMLPSTFMSILLAKNGLEKEMYDKLNVATFSPRSEYGKISEEEMHDLIWQIKAQTGMEFIIFEDKTGKMSTIKGIDKIDMHDEIYSVVSTGQEYYSVNFDLNGERYYGYYYPILKSGEYAASILACYSADNINATVEFIMIASAIISILILILFIDVNGKIGFKKEKKNMWFCDAIEFLKQGYRIRRKDWKGYWKLEDGEVIMHCATPDGDELTPINIKDTDDILFTLSNVAADDWEVVSDKR